MTINENIFVQTSSTGPSCEFKQNERKHVLQFAVKKLKDIKKVKVKIYISNLAENSKFTFYCQNQLLAATFQNYTFQNYTFPLQFQDGKAIHQAAHLQYE